MGGRLIILCGLAGAGKTSLAMHLEAKLNAVRLSSDDWLEALSYSLGENDRRDQIEALQWSLAQTLLERGLTVVIEWGTWAREERDELRIGARKLGAAVELHYLTAPEDVLFERVRKRGRETPPITREQFDEMVTWFEPPDDAELALFDPPESVVV
jgi:predicted kinase